MGRKLGLDQVVEHFTLVGDEVKWLRNKSGASRLGFAVQMKFLTWRGRFPKMRLELPPDAVEHIGRQVGVAASELAFYDFTDRTEGSVTQDSPEPSLLTGGAACPVPGDPGRWSSRAWWPSPMTTAFLRTLIRAHALR